MKTPPPRARWYRTLGGWTRPPKSRVDDAADHGTAFGMEITLLDAASPPAPPAGAARGGWMPRFARRRPPP